MAKKNKRKDIAETARSIVEQATGAKLTGEPLDPPEPGAGAEEAPTDSGPGLEESGREQGPSLNGNVR